MAANARGMVALLLGGVLMLVAAAIRYNDKAVAPEVLALAAPHCSNPSAPVPRTAQPFSIAVTVEAAVLPEGLEEKIALGANAAYAQWRAWLGEDALLHSRMNLRFVGDDKQFREIYGKPDAKNWTTTGFYRMRSNEALILYTPEYRNAALGNAFHEVSHLVTASHLGATPPWLNEGLAEYYEMLNIVDSKVRFAHNPLHIQLLRRQGPVSILAMTALSQKEWMQQDTQRRYASAWSLITFMLQSEDGQRTLQRVVQRAYTQRCDVRADLRESLQEYPGGLQSLEDDWFSWLQTRLSVPSAQTQTLAL